MTDDTDKMLRSMRLMAWERAKGELRAALMTYWPAYARGGEKIDNGFEAASSLVEAFIKEIEDHGLFE